MLMPTVEQLEQRRVDLEAYLNGLLTVTSVRPLLAKFLGTTEDFLLGVDTTRRDNAEVIEMDPAVALAAAREAEFVEVNESGVRVLSQNRVVERKREVKGNTEEASSAAIRAKEKFIREHAHLLNELMPSHDRRFEKIAAESTGPSRGRASVLFGNAGSLNMDIQRHNIVRQSVISASGTGSASASPATVGSPGGVVSPLMQPQPDTIAEQPGREPMGSISAKLGSKARNIAGKAGSIFQRFKSKIAEARAQAQAQSQSQSQPQRGHERRPSRASGVVGGIQDDQATLLQATALADFEAESTDEYTYVSLREGERVLIFDGTLSDGWWYGRNSSGEEGYFPSEYVLQDSEGVRKRAQSFGHKRSLSDEMKFTPSHRGVSSGAARQQPPAKKKPLRQPVIPQSAKKPLRQPIIPQSAQKPLRQPIIPQSAKKPLRQPVIPQSAKKPLRQPVIPKPSGPKPPVPKPAGRKRLKPVPPSEPPPATVTATASPPKPKKQVVPPPIPASASPPKPKKQVVPPPIPASASPAKPASAKRASGKIANLLAKFEG